MLMITLSMLWGAASGFRNAGDISTGRETQNAAPPDVSGLALFLDLAGLVAFLSLLYWCWGRLGRWIETHADTRLQRLLRLLRLVACALLVMWGTVHWLHAKETLEALAFHPWLERFLGFLALGGLIGVCLWLRGQNGSTGEQNAFWPRIIGGLLIGLLGFVLFWVSYRWLFHVDSPYLVSVLLCILVALIALVYAVFFTVTATPRPAVGLLFLVSLCIANGSNWIHQAIGPADDYKLQFDRLHRDTPRGNRLASYYDYPVHLQSKSYLDRTYLKPASILYATNASPIVVTSAYAHQLRNGDRVRITGVQGNPAANGTFPVLVDPKKYGPNKFALAGSRGCGIYTFGGEWIVELEQGRIVDIRRDPRDSKQKPKQEATPDPKQETRLEPEQNSKEDLDWTTIVSYEHGLKDDDEVLFVRSDGKAFQSEPSTVKTRDRQDVRSAYEFLVKISAVDLDELRNGHWYRNPSQPEEGPRKGGVAWVTDQAGTWFQRRGDSDHDRRPRVPRARWTANG